MNIAVGFSHFLVWSLKRVVPRGYQPPKADRGSITEFTGSLAIKRLPSVIFVVPTYIGRCDEELHAEIIGNHLRQTVFSDGCGIDAQMWVALQYTGSADTAKKYAAKVQYFLEGRIRGSAACRILLIDRLGKVNALNHVIDLLRLRNFRGFLGWIDDDVTLNSSGLESLCRVMAEVRAFGAVGAKKTGSPNVQTAASYFFRLKGIARATSFPIPHGCCILVRFSVIAEGIPDRYIGEDGYIAMKLYNEGGDQEPLRCLHVDEGCVCYHIVGGPLLEIVKRIRRTVFENSILLADFDYKKSVRFASETLFHGLLPGISPVTGQRVTVSNRVISMAVSSFYLAALTVFTVRAAIGKPLQTLRWDGYSNINRPKGSVDN
jgi:hypothetical protein